MQVEHGKLKLWLVGLQGLLLPFSTPIADQLPLWLRLAGMCAYGATAALFVYLLKPPGQFNLDDLRNILVEPQPPGEYVVDDQEDVPEEQIPKPAGKKV